jgi:hypothetical protein
VVVIPFTGDSENQCVLLNELGAIAAEYTAAWETFGESVTVLDFDNDGIDDLVVGSPQYKVASGISEGGRIDIFLGPLTEGPSNVPEAPLGESHLVLAHAAEDAAFGGGVASLGDVTSDGFEDLAIRGSFGGAYLLLGGSRSRPAPSVDTIRDGRDGATDAQWTQLTGLGDFTGDGVLDVSVSDGQSIYVVEGGPDLVDRLRLGLAEASVLTISGIDHDAIMTGAGVDRDGDGDEEAWLWSRTDRGSSLWLIGGQSEEVGTVHRDALSNDLASSRLDADSGNEIRSSDLSAFAFADVVGDSKPDAIISRPGAADETGIVYILDGGPGPGAASLDRAPPKLTWRGDGRRSGFGQRVVLLAETHGEAHSRLLATSETVNPRGTSVLVLDSD